MCLILVCIVCLCPTNRTLDLYGLHCGVFWSLFLSISLLLFGFVASGMDLLGLPTSHKKMLGLNGLNKGIFQRVFQNVIS